MIRLEDIGLFVRVAITGSFSSAARGADLLPSQVSVAVRRLETALGVDLFVRSTRSVRLTRKGEQYLPHAEEILSAVRVSRDIVRCEAEGFHGDLSIAVPSDLGRNLIAPWIATFHREHPGLRVRLSLGDGRTDTNGADVALQYGTTTRDGHDCHVLTDLNRQVLVASPTYIEACGLPDGPDDLPRRECIVACTGGDALQQWTFHTAAGEMFLHVRGTWCTDDGDLARRWALAGMGIAFRPWLEVARDVASGELAVLLPGFVGERMPLTMTCALSKETLPVLKALSSALSTEVARFVSEHSAPFL
jgi:DNA-binding transcriptional LysR family regulator